MRGNTPHERCCISQFCAQSKIVLINLSTLFSQKQQMTWKMLHHSVLFTIETCIIKLKDSVWLAVKYYPNYIVSVFFLKFKLGLFNVTIVLYHKYDIMSIRCTKFSTWSTPLLFNWFAEIVSTLHKMCYSHLISSEKKVKFPW